MIQITYNEMGDMMFLRAEGHADFAPKGQDIVCAAVRRADADGWPTVWTAGP